MKVSSGGEILRESLSQQFRNESSLMTDTEDVALASRLEAMPALKEPYATAARQVERDVLGLVMLGVLRGIEKIDPAWFSGFDRYLIFDAALRLYSQGLQPDIVNVSELLEREGSLSGAGGLVGIAELAVSAESFSTISDLVRLLEGFALLRFRKGAREGTQVLVPLADAISVGALHGKSWVVDALDLPGSQIPYVGALPALEDEGVVRVCYAYLELVGTD